MTRNYNVVCYTHHVNGLPLGESSESVTENRSRI